MGIGNAQLIRTLRFAYAQDGRRRPVERFAPQLLVVFSCEYGKNNLIFDKWYYSSLGNLRKLREQHGLGDEILGP